MATSEATRKEEQHGIRPRTSAAVGPEGPGDQAGRLRAQRGTGVEGAGSRRVERQAGALAPVWGGRRPQYVRVQALSERGHTAAWHYTRPVQRHPQRRTGPRTAIEGRVGLLRDRQLLRRT